MPSNSTRPRIDWSPGPAAADALRIARALFPQLGTQAVIDKLVITGLHALRQPPWAPPALWGDDRDEWQLPAALAAPVDGTPAAFPGKSSTAPQERTTKFPGSVARSPARPDDAAPDHRTKP